ncbi:hypothetical protein BRPE67_ECDS01370 (plasmid) [Caballeronia cordobensis]|nr:hypothetical protein BRPE67_ECDS01370 [Burkholderia sp. RPE67]
MLIAATALVRFMDLREIHGVVRLDRLRKSEFVQALVCFVGVVARGVASRWRSR